MSLRGRDAVGSQWTALAFTGDFMKMIGEGVENEDPTNELLDVQTQLEWLKTVDFEDVDCYWKWLELALLIGYRPT